MKTNIRSSLILIVLFLNIVTFDAIGKKTGALRQSVLEYSEPNEPLSKKDKPHAHSLEKLNTLHTNVDQVNPPLPATPSLPTVPAKLGTAPSTVTPPAIAAPTPT